MFTGIVEDKGKVATVGNDGRSLMVVSDTLVDLPVGASVAVSGVCLTVVELAADGACFDVVPETLARTNLGFLGPGDEVNLERAMPAHGRFDGHMVQGHVDGIGQVIALESGAEGVVLRVSAASEVMRHVAPKGSIAVDGVSLTVAGVGESDFTMALIPHTLKTTTLGSLGPGDPVNLETDVIAKYLDRILEARG